MTSLIRETKPLCKARAFIRVLSSSLFRVGLSEEPTMESSYAEQVCFPRKEDHLCSGMSFCEYVDLHILHLNIDPASSYSGDAPITI